MTDWEKGLLAFREGRMREAVERLRAAAAVHEETVTLAARFQTCAFLGAALYALGLAGEAARAFEAAVRFAPANRPPADLLVNLANAYLAAGRAPEATAALRQALVTAPGNVEAAMLLLRLEQSHPGDEPVHGSILGETPDSVKRYLRTLTFAAVPHGGYDTVQVREALSQVEHYVDFLASQVAAAQKALRTAQADTERLRLNEDKLVENMLQSQQEADRHKQEAERLRGELEHAKAAAPISRANGPDAEASPPVANTPSSAPYAPRDLTPLEKLLQKKA